MFTAQKEIKRMLLSLIEKLDKKIYTKAIEEEWTIDQIMEYYSKQDTTEALVATMESKFGKGENKPGFAYYKRETAVGDVSALVAEKQRKREQFNLGIFPQKVMYTFPQVIDFTMDILGKQKCNVARMDIERDLEITYTNFVKNGCKSPSIEAHIADLEEQLIDKEVDILVLKEQMNEPTEDKPQ